MDFYRCEQCRPFRRFRIDVSGNAVLFVLSEHFVSASFPCWLRSWGYTWPPLLKVFHRGESTDAHGIQGVFVSVYGDGETLSFTVLYHNQVNWQSTFELISRLNLSMFKYKGHFSVMSIFSTSTAGVWLVGIHTLCKRLSFWIVTLLWTCSLTPHINITLLWQWKIRL